MRTFKLGLSPIFVIVFTVFIDITGYGIIIPLLPFYVNSFQAGPTALGILIGSFALMQFFFSPLLGKVSDNIGRKPILLLSLFTSFVSFTIFAFANSYLMLLFSRIVAGIATERAVAQAYIADVTNQQTRTKELGKIGAAFGAGFIIGPAFGGILSVYGFSVPGYAAMILTVINILFVLYFLPEPQRKKKNQLEEKKPSSKYVSGLIDSVRKPLIGPTLLILFIVTFAFSTIPVIVPLLSIAFFNFGSLELSYVFIYIGLIQILLQGFLINSLSRRWGEEKLVVIGPIIIATGIVLMPLFQSLIIFFFTNLLIAAGFGIINTSIPALLSKRVSPDEQGSILGVTSSVSSIANIPGPLFSGLIFDILGLVAPFLVSAFFLAAAFGLGCRVYKACKFLNKKSSPVSPHLRRNIDK
jgi:MFS family permease